MIASRNPLVVSQFILHVYSFKILIYNDMFFLEDEIARVWSFVDGTRSVEEISKDCELTGLVVLAALKTLEKKGLIFWKDRF